MFVQSIVFYKENISLEKNTKKGVKSLFSKEFFLIWQVNILIWDLTRFGNNTPALIYLLIIATVKLKPAFSATLYF